MIGQKVGPFEVVELLGRGGMGEVFRAQDKQLNRDVALKILPNELNAQPDRLARFQREAKVLASLQHQNIATIFGLKEFDGKPVLVMELAEGDDLSERIAAGNLTEAEITKVARQMARGLEYAHENNIIHPDLKPANVKVYGDGTVKILDFGLTRAMDPGANLESQESAPFQPTLTQGLTVAGTVLGTAAYMSPEQARGYDVDRRSDIWAFGVILFEMLTQERLFEGQTASDTMAAILRKEPDWDFMPPQASPLLVQICRRCLEKDPNNRMRDIGEVRVALEGSTSSDFGMSALHTPTVSPSDVPKSLPWAMRLALAVLVLALSGVGYLGMTGMIGPKPPPLPMVHSSINLPDGVQMNLNPAAPGPVVVSPDGSRLTFSAVDTNGVVLLYVRDLDEPTARPISGTKGAHYPFWSHDNRTVAFFTATNTLARVDVAGGPIVTICSAENGKGGSWNQNDVILFASSHVSSIFSVPASGGTPVNQTHLEKEIDFRSHRFPFWLPDGETFFYIAVARTGGGTNLDSVLRLGRLDSPESKDLMPCQTNAVYGQGQAMFVHDSILMSRPYDLEANQFTGPSQPIMGGVLSIPAAHLSVVSMNDGDVLAYSAGSRQGFGNSQLFMMQPGVAGEIALNEPLITFGFDLSQDGKRLLLALPDSRNGTFDIWILEVDRNLRTRFTFNTETELKAVWNPDSQWVVFASDREGTNQIYRKKASGTGTPELLFESRVDCIPGCISKDGKLLAYTTTDSSGGYGLGIYDFTLDQARHLYEGVTYSEGAPSISPDGQWIAFSTNETGQVEVFVESLTPGGGRYRVSSSGGFNAQWSPEGDKLYFLSSGGEIRAVEVEFFSGGGLRFGQESKLTDRVENTDAGSFVVNQSTGQIISCAPPRPDRTVCLAW